MTSVERDEYNVYSCAPYVRAEKEPKYSVLSYTWGRFRLEDVEGAPALPFQHVVNFLGRDDIDWAWIDIACIHQEDEQVSADEVGRQVSIFKNAHRAFVWRSQTNHHDLASIIHEVQHHSEQVRYHILDLPTSLSIRQAVESLQKSCIELFDDPWFSSLWTLQELVLRNDALILTREAEPVEYCFGDYTFLSELIGDFANLVLHLEIVGDRLKESLKFGKTLNEDESTMVTCITDINQRIFKAGFGSLFSSNPNVQYGISEHRRTTREVDRIYAIMQIYNIRVGKALDPTCSPKLPELVEEFAVAINTACPMMGQMFVHTETPKEGKSWRITHSSMVPKRLSMYIRPKSRAATRIQSGTMFASGKCCSFVDIDAIAHLFETVDELPIIAHFAVSTDANVVRAPVSLSAFRPNEGTQTAIGAQILAQYQCFDLQVMLLGTTDTTESGNGKFHGDLSFISYIGLLLCSLNSNDDHRSQRSQYRRLGVCTWNDYLDEGTGELEILKWTDRELEIH